MKQLIIDSIAVCANEADNEYFIFSGENPNTTVELKPGVCDRGELMVLDNGNPIYIAITFFKNRKRHFDNGPAVRIIGRKNHNYFCIMDMYFQDGVKHNLNGFAYINYDYSGNILQQNPILKGHYFIKGKLLSEDEFVAQGGVAQKKPTKYDEQDRLRDIKHYVEKLNLK